MHQASSMRQETVIKIHQNKELSQLSLGTWLWELLNSFNLLLERCDAIPIDMMPEEVELTHAEDALIWIYDYTIHTESVEHILWRSTNDQEVINVVITEWETTENFVHESLECLSHVPQAERHASELKQAEQSTYSGLVDVVRVH